MKHIKLFESFNKANQKVADYLTPLWNAKEEQEIPNSLEDIEKFLELTADDSHHYWMSPVKRPGNPNPWSYQSYNGVLYANQGFLFDKGGDKPPVAKLQDLKCPYYLIKDQGYKELPGEKEMPNAELFNKIKELVKNESSSDFDFDEDEDNITFSTRDHGDVGSEDYGQEDMDDARRLAKLIKEKFPNVEMEIETVDEWVNLIIEV